MNIIDHVESFLGSICKGWTLSEQTDAIQVVRFADQPFPGVSTFVSLGLSRKPLLMPNGRNVRQELVFSADARYSEDEVASFMLTFCEFILARQQPLLRGDVVGPSSLIVKSADKNAVYATIPTIFPDGFRTFSDSGSDTVLVWLIPLASSEADFVKSYGWSRFEDILEAKDPDLTNLNRDSVV